MQKIYFSNYSELTDLPAVGNVAGIENEFNHYNLNKVPSCYDKNYELHLERMVAVTGDWNYCSKLLEVRRDRMEAESELKKIFKKYPYDGKSTFSELLVKEINKVKSNK